MKLRRSLVLLVFSGSLFAQTAATTPPLVTAIQGPGNLVKVIPLAPIVVCGWPAVGGPPCTNTIVTYTDPSEATSCPAATPVISPSTTTCSATSDAAGNFQFFVNSPSTATYYFKNGGTWEGPYVVSIGGSGGGGGGGGVSQVNGTNNQINVANSTSTPTISIATNPTLPGNVTITGNVSALGNVFSSALGNTGVLAQAGATSGTAYVCLDSSANFTNVGCPPLIPVASGAASEVQFRNSGTGFLAADAPFNYNSSTHTLNATNFTVGTQNVTTAQNFSFPYQLVTTIPGSPLPIGAAGNSGINISTDGAFCMWVNGGACNDLSTAGGTSLVANPGVSQNVVQPVNTQFSANNFANIRYVTASWNWSQSVSVDLSVAGSKTITLTPCPIGIDTSNNANKPFTVHIPTTNVEEALVTGGTCTSGGASGTIVVTTTVAHSASTNTIASSYSGIQEALNDAGTPGAMVVVPPTGANANALPVYSTIYVQTNTSSLTGAGGGKSTLLCKTRSVCVFLGDRVSSNDFTNITVSGLRLAAGNTFDGIPITNTACASNVSTVTLGNTGANAVAAGDFVDINWTFNNHYIGIHQVATASATQFTYADTNCGGLTTIASQATQGFASLENAGIEDNANVGTIKGIYMADSANLGSWGLWQNHIVVDNDQAFMLEGFDMSRGPHCTANYCGNSVYAPGPEGTNASVLWLSSMNISLNCRGNGVTAWSGNTLHISNSVIQGYAQWGVYTGHLRGGFGTSQLDDVYEESSNACSNPIYGFAANAGVVNVNQSGAVQLGIRGGEGPQGQLPIFANSGNQLQTYNYALVVHDTSNATVSRPLIVGMALVDGTTPTGSIVVKWPRVQGTGTVTYDVLRWAGGLYATAFPYNGNCTGGSVPACGSVATAQAQCSTILCTFTDTASNNTTSYAVSNQNYNPGIFWLAGGIVNVWGADLCCGTVPAGATFLDTTANSNASQSPSFSEEARVPQWTAQTCGGSNMPGEWMTCLDGGGDGNSALANATLLKAGSASGAPGTTNIKGRLNFYLPAGASLFNQEIITLADAGLGKTLATPTGQRPTADANDSWIGVDAGSTAATAQIAFNSPVSFDWCIAQTPNNCSAASLINLTASLLTFKVGITTNSQIVSTLATGTQPFSISSTTRVPNLTTGGNPIPEGCGASTTCAKTILLNGFIISGTVALTGGTATVTSLPFSSTTWGCVANDLTTVANNANMVEATATSATVTGTGTDNIRYICTGN